MTVHAPSGQIRPPDPTHFNRLPITQNPTEGIGKLVNTNVVIVSQPVNSTVHHFSSKSPTSNRPGSEPNLEIPVRRISSPSHIIPSHQLLHDSTVVPVRNSDFQNSGEPVTGKNGAPVIQSHQNQHQKVPSYRNIPFPKVSTNFDTPNSSIQPMISTPHINSNAPPVRQNVSMKPSSSRHNAPPSEPAKSNAPPPHAVKPTFASTLKSIQEQNALTIDISPAKQTTKQGYPAVIFKREDYMVKLAERCKFTLIGKFDSTMPRMEVIRRSFEAQVQLKSNVKITHFNSKHVYIDLDNQLDHDTVWFKKTIWIQGRPMNLFTWTPTFKPSQETPIAPIWVVLPELPWHLYYMEAISELFKSVGRAISLDVATFQKTRGSVAKVKLEIDVTKIRPNYFWIGYDDDENGEGYWQEAQYEDVPSYCSYCRHQGHFVDVCAKKRRDDEMGKKKVEVIPITVDAISQAPQNQNTGTIAGKPPFQKQHYVPKNPIVPISNGPTTATVMEALRGKGGDLGNHMVGSVKLVSAEKSVELYCKNSFGALSEEEIVPVHGIGENLNSTLSQNEGIHLPRDNETIPMTDVNHDSSTIGTDVAAKTTAENNLQLGRIYHGLVMPDVPADAMPVTVPTLVTGNVQKVFNAQATSNTPFAATDIAHENFPTPITLHAKGGLHTISVEEVLPEKDNPTATLFSPLGNTINERGNSSVMEVQNAVDVTTCSTEVINGSTAKKGSNATANATTVYSPTDQQAILTTEHVLKLGVVSAAAAESSKSFGNVEADGKHIIPVAGSTKEWILNSFYGIGQEVHTSVKPSPNNAKSHNLITPGNEMHAHNTALDDGKHFVAVNESLANVSSQFLAVEVERSVSEHQDTVNQKEKIAAKASVHLPEAVHTVENKYTSQAGTAGGKLGKKSSSTGGKNKKKAGKKTGKSVQQTEEEILKAEKMAFWDAILAKSYAENPVIESNIEPLNVRENKATVSIPSQDNFDPANIRPLGSDNDEIESNMALTAYVSPAHSGNTLIPTATLEVMCKQASKVMKEVGRGFFPVTPHARIDTEAHEAPTYFLGDLFEDSPKDQNESSKDVKSKWNLNAPLFIPNALRQQESQVATESVDSQKVPTLQFPNAPSDEVLLKNLDLHDIRGLLHRQNSPPQELPQKFSSAHPGIIEDGSEYEDEDEESTAYNYMEESRHAGLSPRLDQVRKPKLIKKKRRPLEPKKKEEAPKKPKRVQPTRSSKSKSSRAK